MEEYDPSSTESMKDYHIPTSSDMPEVVPIIIEASEPTGPFGAKGVGGTGAHSHGAGHH